MDTRTADDVSAAVPVKQLLRWQDDGGGALPHAALSLEELDLIVHGKPVAVERAGSAG